MFAHPTSFYFILPKTLPPHLIQSRMETLDSQEYYSRIVVIPSDSDNAICDLKPVFKIMNKWPSLVFLKRSRFPLPWNWFLAQGAITQVSIFNAAGEKSGRYHRCHLVLQAVEIAKDHRGQDHLTTYAQF